MKYLPSVEFEYPAPEGVDITVPNAARMYDYALGGRNNYAADREFAEIFFAMQPNAREEARQARQFLIRAVRFLAAEARIRQFIDVGSGLPTEQNVHEVAHQIDPGAHVIYIDYDPVVIAHGNALLATTGNVALIEADLRRPHGILAHETLLEQLDFSRPMALLLVNVLHFITEEEDALGIVATLTNAMPPGSYLAISHASFPPELLAALMEKAGGRPSAPYVSRTPEQIARFFDGFELVEPGQVKPAEWRPGIERPAVQQELFVQVAVGRKPVSG